MIKKILKISNLAVFKDFDWNKTVRDKGRNIGEFKKLNIFYGRNYSGKTTLSRIFQFLENKQIDEKYRGAKFEIELLNSANITQDNVGSNNLDIRVYNSDFIKKNLKFLKDDENGNIESFAILGDENIKIEESLKVKNRILKGDENLTGSETWLLNIYQKFTDVKNRKEKKQKDLDKKLTDKANIDIKLNDKIYGDRFYNISKIRDDIQKIIDKNIDILPNEQIEERKKMIAEVSKDDIGAINVQLPDLIDIINKTNNLLKQVITPSVPLNDLLNDHYLQSWVEQGVQHHKEKRDTCAFCRQKLSDQLWAILANHFNKDSEDLKRNINSMITTLETKVVLFEKIVTVNNDNFYYIFQKDFEKVSKRIKDELEIFNQNIKYCLEKLRIRLSNIFQTQNPIYACSNLSQILDLFLELNEIIIKNNSKTKNLNNDSIKAKESLRLNEIKKFITEINYENEKNEIDAAQIEEDRLKVLYESFNNGILKIKNEIEDLKKGLKDEKNGAEKVNEYLNHYFGNNTLKLDTTQNTENNKTQFSIWRGTDPAFNLSEGECSLIAFCYFIAKLKDENSKDKDLVVWIDDPISSLDNNHIFFIFSIIENIIVKPNKYKQLFISTHNLDFLKYLKKLSFPKIKTTEDKKVPDVAHFIVERKSSTESEFCCMPEYLEKYVTEFNYLFHQIYKCSKAQSSTSDYDIFYNFGNNLRKFLEAYLFYKYPNQDRNEDKIIKFFKDDISTTISGRINNELSHLKDIFDRSIRPVEIPEIPKLAQFILNKIKNEDPEQFDALLSSIGEQEEKYAIFQTKENQTVQ